MDSAQSNKRETGSSPRFSWWMVIRVGDPRLFGVIATAFFLVLQLGSRVSEDFPTESWFPDILKAIGITYLSLGFYSLISASRPWPYADRESSSQGLPFDESLLQSFPIDRKILQALVMWTVSDRTGYPVEMLEPTMEVKDDLGIDSVKWTEITAALQERIPLLPELASSSAEPKTLGEVVEVLEALIDEHHSELLARP